MDLARRVQAIAADCREAQDQDGPLPTVTIRPNPARVQAIVTAAVAMHRGGDLLGALAQYEAALRLDPEHFDASNNRAVALRAIGRIDEAIEALQRATSLHPTRAQAFSNLGNALSAIGQDEAACDAYETAVRLEPDAEDGRRKLAATYGRLERSADELRLYQEITATDPGSAEAWSNLGAILYRADKIAAALACTRRAVAIKPDLAVAQRNLGVLLTRKGDYQAAVIALGQAALAASDAPVLSALGQALVQTGDIGGARVCFERAIAADPEHLDARLGAARTAFLAGDWSRAWPAYEWRWRIEGNHPAELGKPRWQGEPIGGRSILVWAEQGAGDTLHFIRYAPALKRRGARVIAMVQPPLASLIATAPGLDAVLPAGAPRPEFDLHAPLLSLPGLLPEAGFGETSYLSVPRNADVRHPALDRQERKIGIVWAGSPTHKNDRNRSVPLECFLDLCAVPPSIYFSLQKGPAEAQLAEAGAGGLIHALGPLLTSYAETAAALARIDLLISVDTSVAHLAGAMGRPVWCLLPFAPDWRWQLWRTDTPWYPTMRLFRQPRPGDWNSVFEQVGRALREF